MVYNLRSVPIVSERLSSGAVRKVLRSVLYMLCSWLTRWILFYVWGVDVFYPVNGTLQS